MATKKARAHEARQHLDRANAQWNQAAVAAWEPVDPAECVTKCFYALENAVTAAATALGVKWTKKHYEKADLAKRLVKQGQLKTDVSDRLVELNDLRKDVQYGDPGSELASADLEDILTELEEFLSEVDSVIREVEQSDK